MSVHAEWDGESYCTAEGCMNPATHEEIVGMVHPDFPVVEMVCCAHLADGPLAHVIQAIDALPDWPENDQLLPNAYLLGWRNAMRQVKALLHPKAGGS